jgi:4-diphosphocytidyl-2-C-methyl-D-erythritol kinase
MAGRRRVDRGPRFGYGGRAMTSSVSIAAPAKVNLHLEVLGRRADGYHEILSLFQAVSLFDEITLRPTGGPGEIVVHAEVGCPPEENLVTRAVHAWRELTGRDDGVEVTVGKGIPVGAGLGGGSSDAAAVLRGLAALFPCQVSMPALVERAGGLGSDVPFFLGSAAALVEGRGEGVVPLAPRLDFCLVALFGSAGVSTAEAYRALERGPAQRPRLSRDTVLQGYATAPVQDWLFFNSFDATVYARYDECRKARDALSEAGAMAPRLTGSGSTVIGFFADLQSAERCADGLSAAGWQAACLNPLATIPAVCYYK